jgi:hypothetical protein
MINSIKHRKRDTMKVYVVERFFYEDSYIVGIYSTKEKAENKIKECKEQDKETGMLWEYCYGICEVD